MEPNKDEEHRGTLKRSDLYKMHTYRDAIPEARFVWIISPGSEFRYFNKVGGSFTALPNAFDAAIVGVGAIPLSPGSDATAISEVVQPF